MNPSVTIFMVLSVSMVAGQDAPQPQDEPPSCQNIQTKCKDFCIAGKGDATKCDARCTEHGDVCSCTQEKCTKLDAPEESLKCLQGCETEKKPTIDCDTDYSIGIGTCQNVCSIAKDHCNKSQ